MSSQNGPWSPRLRRRLARWWSAPMHLAFDLIGELEEALKAAAASTGLESGLFEPGVRTSDPRHGDFQANGVLAAAKRAGKPPRPIAEALVAALSGEVRGAF